MGVLFKVDNSDWSSPTVYREKKSKEMRVYADFSTGFKDALKNYHHPLPNPEEVFVELSEGRINFKNQS